MALTNTVHRLLTEPTTRERDLLALDISEQEDAHQDPQQQASFLNALTGDLEAKIVRVAKNTDQRLIVVTQDKTLLCLKRHLAQIGKKEWLAPLSTFSTILISLITADFKNALGLSSAEWRAMFLISAGLSIGWLGFAIYKSYHSKTFHEVVHNVVHELGGTMIRG